MTTAQNLLEDLYSSVLNAPTIEAFKDELSRDEVMNVIDRPEPDSGLAAAPEMVTAVPREMPVGPPYSGTGWSGGAW